MLTWAKEQVFSILFPLFCVSCGAEGAWCCDDCLGLLPRGALLACPRCAKETWAGRTCERCKAHSALDGLIAASSYADGTVRNLVRSLKFDGAKETIPLIKKLSVHARGVLASVIPDAIVVPIPLWRRRELRRGFNQAQLLAKELFPNAEYLDALIRTRNTHAQTELDEEERRANPKGAFYCLQKFAGQTILLVDDVFTTGATMEECAKVLKQAGAKEVWGFTVARG